MRKIYALGAMLLCLFMSCSKENIPTAKEPNVPKNFSSTFFPSDGNSATIVYETATQLYKANYGGAELVFSPVPMNPNFKDGDEAAVGISCTNCVELNVSGSYFTAIIPMLPSSYLADIHSQLTTYATQFQQYLSGDRDVNGSYKQATLPKYPQFSYYGTVSGVVVRKASSPTSCMILPSTYIPNPPANAPHQGEIPYVMGSVLSTTHPGVSYDLEGLISSGKVSSVTALSGSSVLTDITYSGTFIYVEAQNKFYVTMKVYHDMVLWDEFTSVETLY